MGKLLSFEFRKLFMQKSYYICTAICLLMGFMTLFRFSSGGAEYSFALSLVNAVDVSSLTMLLGIWSAIFICEDYGIGTIRTVISRGYTRTAVFFAKLIALCCGAVIMLLLCWLVCSLTGAILFDSNDFSFSISVIRSLAAQLLLVIAYACLCNAIASALQKTGVAVAVCAVLPVVVFLLLSFIDSSFYGKGGILNDVLLAEYWIDDLVSAVSYLEPSEESLKLAVNSSGIYIIATVVLGWISVIKREY